MDHCEHHDRLADRIDLMMQTLTRIDTTISSAVVTKDYLMVEVGKVYGRVNTIIGGLATLLLVAGGTIAYLIR